MMKPQVHLEPIRTHGAYPEWVEVHTYDTDPKELFGNEALALLTVRGSNMDNRDQTVDLWVYEKDIRALRDALNEVLDMPPGVIAVRTFEERMAFEKDWDRRFKEGQARDQRPA